MDFFTALLAAALIMGILDFLWLGVIAKKLYYGEMGDILLKKPNMTAAVLFYAIYVAGSVILVVMPALAEGAYQSALWRGALLGFVAYATYDLTNLATMKGFSKKIVAIDLTWGAFITAAVCVGSYVVVDLLI